MGQEDKNGEMVVYCNGQPMGPVTGLPEITVNPEKMAEIADTVGAVWDAIVVMVKGAAAVLAKLWDTILVEARAEAEFREAMRWAEANNHLLAHRYHHAKKGRIRKKYRKRILAWYRAEVIGGEV